MKLLARLLHLANASPPPIWRSEFYELKDRLCRRFAEFRGHEMQEIRKACWGEIVEYDDYGDPVYRECDENCRRCNGTGIFDLRWVRLERWHWAGYVFHRPTGDTRVPPDDLSSVTIKGRIEHPDYGRASNEAVLWLYLLCGEWRLFFRSMRAWCCCGRYWYPLTNCQRVVWMIRMKLSYLRGWWRRFRRRFEKHEDIPF